MPLFGVHNHYNNNADGIGDFVHPVTDRALNEASVRISNRGIVVFNLDRKLNLTSKLELAAGIDSALKQKFGKGLSFATSASSDSVRDRELNPYFNQMKEIVPNLTTIYTSVLMNETWIVPQGLKVDHLLDQWSSTPMSDQIENVLNPIQEDKAEPDRGWVIFEASLQEIYDIAHNTVLAKRSDAPPPPVPRREPS